MGQSSIPAAVSGLLALWQAAPALAGVDVRDANTPPDESSAAAVWAGYQDPAANAANAVDTAVDFTETGGGLGSRGQETYAIHCAAGVADGNSDFAAARTAVAALYSACREAVAASRDLGGAIQGMASAGPGSLRYEPLDNEGIKALMLFDVMVSAFTT